MEKMYLKLYTQILLSPEIFIAILLQNCIKISIGKFAHTNFNAPENIGQINSGEMGPKAVQLQYAAALFANPPKSSNT